MNEVLSDSRLDCILTFLHWSVVYCLEVHLDSVLCQVNTLLYSMDIDDDIQAKGPHPRRLRELEENWNVSPG